MPRFDLIQIPISISISNGQAPTWALCTTAFFYRLAQARLSRRLEPVVAIRLLPVPMGVGVGIGIGIDSDCVLWLVPTHCGQADILDQDTVQIRFLVSKPIFCPSIPIPIPIPTPTPTPTPIIIPAPTASSTTIRIVFISRRVAARFPQCSAIAARTASVNSMVPTFPPKSLVSIPRPVTDAMALNNVSAAIASPKKSSIS
jgi:hypothetical protein